MNTVIDIQSLNFAYAAVPVLSDIDLQIDAGEFVGIVGPNAGGKSTLLKLILGLLQAKSGTIQVLGQAAKTARRQLGYVPQYPNFARDFPITVEQLVQMGLLGTQHHRSRTAGTAIQQALAEVEVDHIAKRQIGSLSGGQLQRVLMARALVSQPRILLLDEPTANIDQRMESEIFDLLQTLNRRMTILVVSHDVAFISGYVNRVACVNQTLVCHQTDAIDGNLIHDLYGEHVHRIAHVHA